MLEGLVAWVLNNYLGRYVENLNTDQLSIALLSGEVELENLPLRKDALRHLGIPVEIRAGFIGKVRLQVPVRQLRSAPWVIAAERLYVVAAPVCLERWDQAAEDLAAHERKLSALDALEMCWRNETDNRQNGSSTYYASSYSSWLSYGTGVISDIMENLQLRIKDVHIRYEDASSCFACGLSVSSLSAQSCDENWIPQFTHRRPSDDYSYKTIDLNSLALYWQEIGEQELMSDMSTVELTSAMSQDSINEGRSYIVSPVSGYAHVKRNRSELPLRSNSEPRLVCDLRLDEVPIQLSERQHERLVCGWHTLDFITEVQANRRWRPPGGARPTDEPRLWWLYAVRCVSPGAWPGRWLTAEQTTVNASENIRYVQIYEAILAQPSAALTHQDKKLKEHVEWSRDGDQLRALREAAMRRVPCPGSRAPPPPPPHDGKGALAHWFPQWWGWYSVTGEQTTSSEQADKQLEGEILEALSDAVRDNTLLRRDAVFGRFSFTLKRGTLTLCGGKNLSPALELQFEQFQLSVDSRPRTSSHRLELALGSLCLRDLLTEGTLFPVLVGPPEARTAKPGLRLNSTPLVPLFQLEYETGNTQTKLKVCSQPLDVVYQPEAARWLVDFVCGPHHRPAARSGMEEMKARTKQELMRNWESIVEGRIDRNAYTAANAGSWDLQLDVSAPQIIFVERFTDQFAAVAVIDLGRLHVTNVTDVEIVEEATPVVVIDEEITEDDEMFVTPCSTPPGSEASRSETDTTMGTAITSGGLNERLLYARLYECYTAELSDIQVLTCRVRDGWRHAHTRGSSSMHVLERFSITARCERRLVRTSDPMYPAFTLCASLPRLVLHVNEHKVAAARVLFATLDKPVLEQQNHHEYEHKNSNVNEDDDVTVSSTTETTCAAESSRLLMLQLAVEHVCLQVQSRGRSVAELQVTGASVTFTRRPLDTGVTLTVRGLLLVDALQTYGADYELLVASHRHVGMDSVSGSLRDSEPTSPTSPSSPDPAMSGRRATSPVALTRALSGLAVSPQPQAVPMFDNVHQEPLICVEYTAVQGVEPVRIANIQFNNLDIIANQETIVELVGFVRRAFPTPHEQSPAQKVEVQEEELHLGRTELTFDFHRLNVLLMRGVRCERTGEQAARKIATASMSEARIQATVDGRDLSVRGSLGGLQLLDLTPEGNLHRRIISVGRDPLAESPRAPLYYQLYLEEEQSLGNNSTEALGITIARHPMKLNELHECVNVEVRMASVWYTHSPQLLAELQSCAAEFQQYLSELARTIRTAAADMALGLVHSQLSLHRLSAGGGESPVRVRRRSSSNASLNDRHKRWHSLEMDEDEGCDEEDGIQVRLRVDVVLDSPVVVLPRNPDSTQVFVAHLGRISFNNLSQTGCDELYDVEVRDMNLYSLQTVTRRVPGSAVPRADFLYNCDTLAEPVLHDTVVQLHISRIKTIEIDAHTDTLLLECSEIKDKGTSEIIERLEVTGSVVTALRVSLTREQYEQVFDTFNSITISPITVVASNKSNANAQSPPHQLSDINEEEIGVGILSMDPHVRARLFPGARVQRTSGTVKQSFRQLRIGFELPAFTVELRRADKAVALTLREFAVNCERNVPHETNIQVSLRTLYMDDLGQPEGSKFRNMVISTASEPYQPPPGAFVSHSLPADMAASLHAQRYHSYAGSLPDHLETQHVLGATRRTSRGGAPPRVIKCPVTPPPSASESPSRRPITDNLVLVSCLLVEPQMISASDFSRRYGSLQQTTCVDFNSLNMVISAESWGLVFDFFGGVTEDSDGVEAENEPIRLVNELQEREPKIELIVSVRSLTLTLVRGDGNEIARASVSGVRVRRVSDLVDGSSDTDGRLGSMSLIDLTEHGRLYRERFQTLGERALHVSYRTSEREMPGAHLRFEMATVLYVHTRRFACELQSFFDSFGGAASNKQTRKRKTKVIRTSLEVQARAPVILLPVSSTSSEILVADLGRLTITNTYRDGEDGCSLDVMSVELLDMDLYAAMRTSLDASGSPQQGLRLGNGAFVARSGHSLLDDKCRLVLTIEMNLSKEPSSVVPDLSIRGDLSTLQGALELAQYRLIRGLLTHNIGEPLDDLLTLNKIVKEPVSELREPRTTLTLLHLGLQNVTVRLNENGGESLASIHFIKSRLTVESFSDGAQDVDLLSQEIVLVDVRKTGTNVFTEILRPGDGGEASGSGLEIHSRRRPDHTEFTVLLNNMRVMLVPDWWSAAKEYIFSEPLGPPQVVNLNVESRINGGTPVTVQQPVEVPHELKINITNSEVTVLQDTARYDTNALTLRSTTVISYRPGGVGKPLSCSLNHCELFSCVPGREDDTALSIIDPVTIGVELSEHGTLEVQVQQRLTVRLSYHDCRMLAEMARCLGARDERSPKRKTSSSDTKMEDGVRRLIGLGFSEDDCREALDRCSGELEEAALWLTQYATHDEQRELLELRRAALGCERVTLRAMCLILTFIDDCADADVPLAELCLTELTAEQPLLQQENEPEEKGSLECKLSCDYYNRALSGWEPCLEPWRCHVSWVASKRLLVDVRSDSLLDINITAALVELYRSVSDSWSKDMRNGQENEEQSVYFRRRRRFVPFALKNDTGSRLCFSTLLASRHEHEDDSVEEIERSPERDTCDTTTLEASAGWKWVEPGETVPFEFGDGRTGRRRHGDTHRQRLHRLRVQVVGWRQLAHISVDRVGAYFRDVGGRETSASGGSRPGRARLVFDVRLEGSARKLVIVRSALVVINKLPEAVDVRLGATAEMRVESGANVPVPLEYSHQQLHVRPSQERRDQLQYSYCQPEIDWRNGNHQKGNEHRYESRVCRSGPRSRPYHLCAELRCEMSPADTSPTPLPAHTITLLPALLVVNLLPHELHYSLRDGETESCVMEGMAAPGNEAAVSWSCAEDETLDLQLRLEGFRCRSGVRIGGGANTGETQCRVRLEDTGARRLYLQATITYRGASAGIRVAVSAPYWIVNRTGLPLVFRQEGVASDTAGQFEEHEVARMVAPLLFSWTDTDASPSVVCRVGSVAAGPGGQSHWSQNFHLRRGVQVRRLKVTYGGVTTSDGTAKCDAVFVVGVEVRPGRGRYRRTNIVTVTPRHQIHNKSSRTLQFSQQCHAGSVSDPGARSNHVEAVPGCQLPFHWPRLDREQLLCVRWPPMSSNTKEPTDDSLWSGGLRIDQPRSLHVSLRDRNTGHVRFLRLEIVPRGATLHAVFSDSADTLPPPLRLDNTSEVTVTFSQQDVTHTCVAKAKMKVPYAWDEPDRRPSVLVVMAPGGATAACDMDKLGPVAQLTYENFIYVAFTGTFTETNDDRPAQTDVLCQRLVLDVADENGKVSLATKQPGRRSQLWRMTSTGQLQHEGSPADRVLVLDIEGPAPQPSRRDSRLALRRPDPRRRSTQTWRFTSDGRLCCAHENMCVQSAEGLWGLRSAGAVVLGVPRELPQYRTSSGVPIEQAVGKQRMRPGSGFLSVEVTTDGPTRVLAVRDDIAERTRREQGETEHTNNVEHEEDDRTEMRLVVRLSEGLGISVVGRGPPQELMYFRLSNIIAELSQSGGRHGSRQLCLSVGDLQADNQLFDTGTEVVMYAQRARNTSANDPERLRAQGPALSVSAELQNPTTSSVLIFRHLVVRVNPLAVNVEETLLLRMAEFVGADAGIGGGSGTAEALEQVGDDETRPGSDATTAAVPITRYYFGVISLAPEAVKLSVRTAGKLPQRLRTLRRRLGLTLIQFEDASIVVEPYLRKHSFDTALSTWRSVYAHFREELVWQAAVILGNVDFLGGPLGLVNDVSEGVSGLIHERSVGALVMNVTHGISNSAAKVTDALGDGLGRVLIMDEAHEETRQRIRRAAPTGGGGHLVAGIKGLGFGLLDGATGLFRHVYEGATSDGVQGAFAGVGRGLLGVVAKPMVGVLDLAGEAARAVRDSSRGASRQAPDRARLPRVATAGPGCLLPRYGSGREAKGQAHLFRLNAGDRSERFVAYGSLRCSGADDLRLVVGTDRVRVVTRTGTDSLTVVTEVRLEDVAGCVPVSESEPLTPTRHYMELAVRSGVPGEAGSVAAVRRPRIRCDTEEIAKMAARQVNFARRMLAEHKYTLRTDHGGDVTAPM